MGSSPAGRISRTVRRGGIPTTGGRDVACRHSPRMKEVFQVIEMMKREGVIKDYAVTGAIGAIFYVEPFNTADIDFLVNLPSSDSLLISLEPIHSWLRSRGYEIDSGGSFVVEGWPIQYVPVGSELAAEALREAHYLPFEPGVSVRVVKAEYLAAEAVRIGRPKDIQRVSMLILVDDFDADLFADIAKRFSLEDKWKKIEPHIRV